MFLCRINENYPQLSPNTPSYLELCPLEVSPSNSISVNLSQGNICQNKSSHAILPHFPIINNTKHPSFFSENINAMGSHEQCNISSALRQDFFILKQSQKSTFILLDRFISLGLFKKSKTFIIAKFHRTD